LHVLGLVLNVFEDICPPTRLAADKWTLQTRYPIYFVVKNHRPGLPGPSPEALETGRTSIHFWIPACFRVDVT
jgi:hypothetical protein